MCQLIIIDVQNKYSIWFNDTNLLQKIKKNSFYYSSIIYIWDNTDGDDFQEELPEDWNDSFEFDKNEQEIKKAGFYQNFSYVIEKQFGFFQAFMKDVNAEDLVQLGKFMLKNKIFDIQEIKNYPELEKKFLSKFKSNIISLYENEESFNIPDDLIQIIRDTFIPGLTLVGGGLDECLAEISLLLQILEIDHKIDYSLTY